MLKRADSLGCLLGFVESDAAFSQRHALWIVGAVIADCSKSLVLPMFSAFKAISSSFDTGMRFAPEPHIGSAVEIPPWRGFRPSIRWLIYAG